LAKLRFKIVRVETAGHEILGRLSNLIVARAAFDVSPGKQFDQQFAHHRFAL
jgi:hypothetical protein